MSLRQIRLVFLLLLQPYGTDLFPMSIYCLGHNFCSPWNITFILSSY